MRAGTRVVGLTLLLVAALTACGEEPTRTGADGSGVTASASPSPGPTGTAAGAAGGGTSAPDEAPGEEPVEQPVEQPDEGEPAAAPAGSGGGPDLDGDGRADSVTLLEVPGTGWSFDVRLADGRETSAPLAGGDVVPEDVAVVGAVDLDQDGADEVLVRTLRAVAGENVVAFRLDGDGVWLVRDQDGAPFELSTAGGMTGPRS